VSPQSIKFRVPLFAYCHSQERDRAPPASAFIVMPVNCQGLYEIYDKEICFQVELCMYVACQQYV
jgi:hypothetical protein